jgi:2'-5' RNA ligase
VSDHFRLFIAIGLPGEVRERIAALQREWQTHLRGNPVRWTPVEQIHLTLRFLGNVPSAAVPELEVALRRACRDAAGFELSAGGCGCFPHARQPRVLWVTVRGDVERLAALQTRVVRETQSWGEIEAREFRAHLTIGRVTGAPPPAPGEISRCAQTLSESELGQWRVNEVLLMRSELSPQGATHTVLAKAPLGH